MKRSVLALLLVVFSHALGAPAEENVRAAQTQLRQEGFYFGDPNGLFNTETSAAITRYQIRHGLQITGELDAQTAKALGVRPRPSTTSVSTPSLSGTWRKLRNGEQQFVPSESQPSSNASSPAPQSRSRESASHNSKTTPRPLTEGAAATTNISHERARDYVAAFVLAGLDPKVGAELEFFADRVKYFGDAHLSRDQIRRDLLRYDARWPERRFWLAGDIDVHPEANQRLRVTFPLRYELTRKSERASGTVEKTLLLQKTADDDLEIVAVNEKKIK
jgi:hypothetical protein